MPEQSVSVSNETKDVVGGTKKKKAIFSKEEKASRNLTLMIITIAGLYCVGIAPNSFGLILGQFYSTSSLFYRTLQLVANITLFVAAGCDIFIYYNFNKKFKKIFKKIFKLE